MTKKNDNDNQPNPDLSPDDIQQMMILFRIQLNLQHTGHPFHHQTASGVIVDADPTLEYLISKLSDPAPSVPVDRTYYGFDPYGEANHGTNHETNA